MTEHELAALVDNNYTLSVAELAKKAGISRQRLYARAEYSKPIGDAFERREAWREKNFRSKDVRTLLPEDAAAQLAARGRVATVARELLERARQEGLDLGTVTPPAQFGGVTRQVKLRLPESLVAWLENHGPVSSAARAYVLEMLKREC